MRVTSPLSRENLRGPSVDNLASLASPAEDSADRVRQMCLSDYGYQWHCHGKPRVKFYGSADRMVHEQGTWDDVAEPTPLP